MCASINSSSSHAFQVAVDLPPRIPLHRRHTCAIPLSLPRACTPPPPLLRPVRLACRVQYNGASFSGWERKPNRKTIQGTLEEALEQICGTSIRIFAASKTDAATHAASQIFHFDAPIRLSSSRAWTRAINSRLPSDIVIEDSSFTFPSFHARHSAMFRTYRYTILTSRKPNVFLAPLAWHYYQHTLDVSKMHAAAQCLLSDVPKDLSAFRKARAPAAHTQISVVHISVERALDAPHLVHIEVRASWFVYGMMRLLSSALVQVGSGVMSVAQFQRAVEEGRRQDVKFSAPACGLCLVDVTYPADVDPFLQKGNESDATLLPMGIASCNDPAT